MSLMVDLHRTAWVDSLKVLDPDGRLEKRTLLGAVGTAERCQKETSRPIISDRLGCLREGCLGLGDELAHNYGHGEDLLDASGCLTCRE
jgi:hypothetical protein